MEFTYRRKQFDIEGFNQRDHISRHVIENKTFYEADLLEYMRAVTAADRKANSICIDVGANIGNHSVYFGSFLADRVVSIEPNRLIHSILHRNLSTNLKQFEVFHEGLGAEETTGQIVLSDECKNNIGMARVVSLSPSTTSAITDASPVTIRTLDALLCDGNPNPLPAGHVLLIKIDVEGMELDVLKGARQTIQHHMPHLFVEAATREELSPIEAFLSDLAYERISCWASTPVYHFAHRPSASLRRRAAAHAAMHKPLSKAKSIARRLIRRAASLNA